MQGEGRNKITAPCIRNHAFSLVELSIVLVILGLLVGGILSGQSLIRAAELRSVTTEYQKYIAAGHTFKDKYFAIPGDMANATAFWGKDAVNCNGHSGAAGTPGTCNGDGDGTLEFGGANATGEMHQFWKQLALAGLIEGTYSGIDAFGGGQGVMHGTNAPRSKLSSAGWGAFYYDAAAHAAWTTMNYYNEIHVGKQEGSTAYAPILKPEEAWNIDTKLDDGKPQRGKVIAVFWDTCTSAANGTDLNGDYLLSTNAVECSLSFPSSF